MMFTLDHNSESKIQLTLKLKTQDSFQIFGLQGKVAQEEPCKIVLGAKEAAVFRLKGPGSDVEASL